MSDININIRLVSSAATQGLNEFGAGAKRAGQKLDGLQLIVKNTQGAFNSFIGNLGATIVFRAFSGLINGISNSVTNLRAFETALVGVGKTTGLSGDALVKLGQDLEALSKRIPVASTELAGMAQTAAQLGVKGTDNILKFTETMARLASATDIIGEQGAIAFARIINVTGESVQNIDRLGSSIVSLGNNFAATESQILTVSNEVAKGGARFGITAEQVLGLSTAMSALGTEAQVGGSTIQKVFSLVEIAIGKGGSSLEKFTSVLGLNNEEFTTLFETKPDQFFLKLVEGLKKSADGGKNLSTSLAELGFNDLRVTKTLGPLIDRTDLLTEALNLSSKAYKENTSLIEESEAAFATLDSNLTTLSNSWIVLTNAIVGGVVPAINASISGLTKLIDVITENLDIIITFAAISTVAFIAFNANVLLMLSGLTLMQAAMVGVRAVAVTMWAAINLPVTIAIAAIAALTAIVVVLIRNWDTVTLSVLRLASATTTLLGISIPGLDSELERLEAKDKILKDVIKKKEEELRLERLIQSSGGVDGQRAEQRLGSPGGAGQTGDTSERRLAEQRAEDLKTDQQKRLETLKNFGEQENELKLEQQRAAFLASDELDAAREEVELQLKAEKLAKELEDQKAFLTAELFLFDEHAKTKIDNQKKENARKIDDLKKSNNASLDIERTLAKQRNDIVGAGFGLASALAKSGSKEQFIIQKAAALAQIALARGTALGLIPMQVAPLLDPTPTQSIRAAAAAKLTAGVNIAAAIGTATVLASAIQGFQDGGIVGGGSFSGDKVLARVNSGEMILNRQQQTQLFNQSNGGSSGGQMIEVTSIIQIDENEIGRAVSRQVANGLALGEGGV